MGPGMMGWGGWFSGILMLIIAAVMIIGAVYLVKWLIKKPGESKLDRINAPQAIDILKERYARGEIDRQEFEEKKKDILA